MSLLHADRALGIHRGRTTASPGAEPSQRVRCRWMGALFCGRSGQFQPQALLLQTKEVNVVDLKSELICEVGSRAHGLAIDGTDDRDLLGIACEPKQYVIGLKKWETSVTRTRVDGTSIPEGERSGPGDTDHVVHSLRKFVSLAMNGNPTIITLFWAQPEDEPTGVGLALRGLGPEKLLSQRALSAYLGYLKQQKERLLGERGQKRTKRPELVEAHGYDTKYAAHALRLGWQGIELSTEGRLSLPIRQPERHLLLAVRTGQVSFDEVIEEIEDAEDTLLQIRDSGKCALPEQPDRAWADQFLVDAYEDAWNREEA